MHLGFIMPVVGRGCRVRLVADAAPREIRFPPALLPCLSGAVLCLLVL